MGLFKSIGVMLKTAEVVLEQEEPYTITRLHRFNPGAMNHRFTREVCW